MIGRDKFEKGYREIRPLVIERDGNKCIKCSSNITLEVHHIDGYRNTDIRMLAMLCCLCHGVAPMGEELFSDWLLNGESGLDVLRGRLLVKGVCSLTDEEMLIFCSELIALNIDMGMNKFRKGREHIRKSGLKCEGRKAYGERLDEVVILERMKVLRSKGATYAEIAGILNEEKVLTRMGKPWRGTTIAKIFAREAAQKINNAMILTDEAQSIKVDKPDEG